MLRALDVRDFVLVERVALEFGAGFGVLTGETGAGKSMLVDAIELLVGGRAEGDLVRAEAERAQVQDSVLDLKRLNLAEGEWERVSAEHTRLQHGSSLLAGAQSSLEALAEADGATLAQLDAVASRLRALSEHDNRLKAVTEMLESAAAQAGEAARELRHYAERVDLDPAALREAEARIEALHAAARRHRVRPEALAARLAELEARLSELALSGDPEALKREVASARGRYDAAAKELSA